jgi:hypothetical protein
MNFLYPRTISILRSKPNTAVGALDYSGVTTASETLLAKNIAAHIQAERQGTLPDAKLAGDAAGQSIWRIIFKASKGLVQDRDFIVDDLGVRYHIISAGWNPLITTCIAQIMET